MLGATIRSGVIMTTRRLAALPGAFLVAAILSSAAAAQSMPTIDLQARCKRSEAAQMEMMGDKAVQNVAFDSCMRSESDARNAITKAWPDIPATYKTFCVRPSDFSPSYIEWIACLELMIDLRKLRAASNSRPTDSDGRCPAIRYANDGSIVSIWACPIGGNPSSRQRRARS
jgi:hypothetical protein